MNTIRYTLDPKNPPRMSRAQKARFDAMKGSDIDYSDIPEFDEAFFQNARKLHGMPQEKKRITIRLDSDVVEWLKSSGKGYQTRANKILRMAMEYQQPPMATES